jgi:hypothetical protein
LEAKGRGSLKPRSLRPSLGNIAGPHLKKSKIITPNQEYLLLYIRKKEHGMPMFVFVFFRQGLTARQSSNW